MKPVSAARMAKSCRIRVGTDADGPAVRPYLLSSEPFKTLILATRSEVGRDRWARRRLMVDESSISGNGGEALQDSRWADADGPAVHPYLLSSEPFKTLILGFVAKRRKPESPLNGILTIPSGIRFTSCPLKLLKMFQRVVGRRSLSCPFVVKKSAPWKRIQISTD